MNYKQRQNLKRKKTIKKNNDKKWSEMFARASKLGYGIHWTNKQWDNNVFELRLTKTNEIIAKGGLKLLSKLVNRYWKLRIFS